MKIVHRISFIGRMALMATMVLGLLYWLAQLSFLGPLLNFLAQINLTTIHMLLGVAGSLSLIMTGLVAVLTPKIKLLGVAGIIYALLMPAFGVTQAMFLAGNLHWLIQIAHLLVGIGAMYLSRAIDRRYQRSGHPSPEQHPIGSPLQTMS
jgi:hypothetical protein